MVVTSDARRAEKLRCLRSHGSKPKYHHRIIGGNFRLDAIQAAVVSAKLPHLDGWTAARQRNAERYNQLFAQAGLAVGLPAVVTDRHIFNQYVIRISDRDGLLAHLKKQGCCRDREGGGHTIFTNPATGAKAPVPRHIEIDNRLARKICQQLAVSPLH